MILGSLYFCRWENTGTERLRHWPEVSQLESGKAYTNPGVLLQRPLCAILPCLSDKTWYWLYMINSYDELFFFFKGLSFLLYLQWPQWGLLTLSFRVKRRPAPEQDSNSKDIQSWFITKVRIITSPGPVSFLCLHQTARINGVTKMTKISPSIKTEKTWQVSPLKVNLFSSICPLLMLGDVGEHRVKGDVPETPGMNLFI